MGVEPRIGMVNPPKWMVKILEKPMNKWMIWGALCFLLFISLMLTAPFVATRGFGLWVLESQTPSDRVFKATVFLGVERCYFEFFSHRPSGFYRFMVLLLGFCSRFFGRNYHQSFCLFLEETLVDKMMNVKQVPIGSIY